MRRHAIAFLTLLAPLPAQQAPALPHAVPHRGALVYERRTDQFAFTPAAPRVRAEWPLPIGDEGGADWRYFACPADRAPAGFEQPGFDDSAWATGRGEFGTEGGAGKRQRTAWTAATLCLRTKVDTRRKKPRFAMLRVNHDDGVRIWLNGALVAQLDGVARDQMFALGNEQLEALARGECTLAVRADNTGGPGYVDVGLCTFTAVPAGVKTIEELQKVLGEDRAQAARIQGELIGGFRPAPMLLQGELDQNQDHVRLPPGDLRELGWWLAMDLTRGVGGGPLQIEATRIYRLGDLQCKGKVGGVDAEGWQDLEVQVRNAAEPALLGDSKRFVDRYVRPSVLYGFDGRLRVRRRLELRDGRARVAEFQTTLTGDVLRGRDWKEHVAHVDQSENWKLQSVREGQDSAFKKMVADALARGSASLRNRLADVGAPDLRREDDKSGDTYHTGRLALGLLALLKSGIAKDDEVVQRCLQELRGRRLIDTYSLGLAMMALEAYYAPANEMQNLRAGAIDRPSRRRPAADDLALLKRWADQLLQNIDTRVDAGVLLRFNYTRGERFDNSVNQYGLLGLYSAHLCGVDIAPQVWEAAINHLVTSQGEARRKIDLELVDYRAFARQGDGGGTRAGRTPVKVAGWNYETPKADGEATPRYGSMTCAGITGLAICQAALLDQPGNKRSKLQGDATAARTAGLAWLAENMTVRYHAGDIDRQQHWFYYYLYGLERAALLSGIALLQDRDWYFEGAMQLVLTQQPDGSWPGELHFDQGYERDAMAILFLKQSTLPVLTGQ